MLNQFSRTEMLIGKENQEKLKNMKVAVFGIGGVGSYAAMALARSGIYNIDIVDNDTVSITNINRQLIANLNTVGRKKVDVMKEMILDINREAVVNTYDVFLDKDTISMFDFSKYDYVIDAIDTVSAKLMMIEECYRVNTKIISAMGAGNKFDPTKFEVTDIYKTSVCPLAKVMRYELKKRGIKKLKVVYSKEIPKKPVATEEKSSKRQTPGSMAFVPSVSGLIIASEVVRDSVTACGLNKEK